MFQKVNADQHEISVVDVYYFFKNGWKVLLIFSVTGLFVGLSAAFLLPVKYQASALIEVASVAKKNIESGTVVATSVEPVSVLAEKMKSPTYYSVATLEACGFSALPNPPRLLVDALKPMVARASPFVAVQFRASSPEEATRCLEHVLRDVVNQQGQIATPLVNNIEVMLTNASLELQANLTEQEQQRLKNREKLSVAKSKLATAERFVEQFSKDSLSFQFGDQQFSAKALLLSTLIDQQNEIKDLEIQINSLELEVAANMTDKDQAVRRMTNTVSALRNSLLPPNTKPATFASPIYAPDSKVEPKRSLVMLSGLVTGGLMGLLWLAGVRMRNNIRTQLKNF